MEKVNRFKRTLIIAVVLLLVILVIAGVYWQTTPRMLYPGEVRDYEGQDLSSISDFRENSIKGPQNVNESHYQLKITGLVKRVVRAFGVTVVRFSSPEHSAASGQRRVPFACRLAAIGLPSRRSAQSQIARSSDCRREYNGGWYRQDAVGDLVGEDIA